MWLEKIFSLDLALVSESCSPLASISQRYTHVVMAISVFISYRRFTILDNKLCPLIIFAVWPAQMPVRS